MSEPQQYTLHWRGQESGPFPLGKIKRQLANGEITLEHEILVDGRWVSLHDFFLAHKDLAPEGVLPASRPEMAAKVTPVMRENRVASDSTDRKTRRLAILLLLLCLLSGAVLMFWPKPPPATRAKSSPVLVSNSASLRPSSTSTKVGATERQSATEGGRGSSGRFVGAGEDLASLSSAATKDHFSQPGFGSGKGAPSSGSQVARDGKGAGQGLESAPLPPSQSDTDNQPNNGGASPTPRLSTDREPGVNADGADPSRDQATPKTGGNLRGDDSESGLASVRGAPDGSGVDSGEEKTGQSRGPDSSGASATGAARDGAIEKKDGADKPSDSAEKSGNSAGPQSQAKFDNSGAKKGDSKSPPDSTATSSGGAGSSKAEPNASSPSDQDKAKEPQAKDSKPQSANNGNAGPSPAQNSKPDGNGRSNSPADKPKSTSNAPAQSGNPDQNPSQSSANAASSSGNSGNSGSPASASKPGPNGSAAGGSGAGQPPGTGRSAGGSSAGMPGNGASGNGSTASIPTQVAAIRADGDGHLKGQDLSLREDQNVSARLRPNVVFLIDQSYSMRGSKGEEAHRQLASLLGGLDKDSTFYIIFFHSSGFDSMPSRNPLAATPENIQAMLQWSSNVRHVFGSKPSKAVMRAFDLNPKKIWLISDGKFSKSATDAITESNKALRAEINTIGIFNASGEENLRSLADKNGGAYRFVPAR